MSFFNGLITIYGKSGGVSHLVVLLKGFFFFFFFFRIIEFQFHDLATPREKGSIQVSYKVKKKKKQELKCLEKSVLNVLECYFFFFIIGLSLGW